VVVAGRVQARGHDSDVAVEAPFGGVYEFRAGKVVRVLILGSRDEALDVVGLSERARRFRKARSYDQRPGDGSCGVGGVADP
jgi:hypothetical protein